MRIATSDSIRSIDAYAVDVLKIPTVELIDRSGRAVAEAVHAHVARGGDVVFLVGQGNNGADGYAAACRLCTDYRVTVYDALGCGPKSDGAQHFFREFVSVGGQVHSLLTTDGAMAHIRRCDCLVDAVFGTGFHGPIPRSLAALTEPWRASRAYKIAIDVPLGVNADTAEVEEGVLPADTTVALSMLKAGHVCYPAKDYVGSVMLHTLDLPTQELSGRFASYYRTMDREELLSLLPQRPVRAHKGTFGHAMLLVGSARYRGAARLSLEAALRCGAGYVSYVGERALAKDLSMVLPEALYTGLPAFETLTEEDIQRICLASTKASSLLIGSGCGQSEALFRLIRALITSSGAPLILDADALNCISRYSDSSLLKQAARLLILTPHPLELSRLCGRSVPDIEAHRLPLAKTLAKEWGCILVLKGAGTVITDGERVYINSTGSSALSKAGTGDVLAGAVASFAAYMEPLSATALAVYLHGLAADTLSQELSAFGVLPSELPRAMARQLARFGR